MNASTSITVNHMAQHGDHAIVIGGSIAGLLSASVLARHFARVTIIERDRLPEEAGPRKGVPQGNHAHQLLTRAAWVLEDLLPGIGQELLAAGAEEIDCFNQILMFVSDRPLLRMPPGPTTYAGSRALVEWVVRQRVAALPQVQFVEASDVTGLIHSPAGDRIAGVSLQAREPGAQPVLLRGDLVVDASGRSSRMSEWLEALGYGRPEETVIEPHVAYSSRVYARPTNPLFDQGILLVPERPELRRAGIIIPMEGNRWMVTLIGYGDDAPPHDEEGFLTFARNLQHQAFYDAIKNATPLSPVRGYRRMENHQRHYERMERWPEGLVVLGDAAIALNPLYGQGMAMAALGAQALGKRLAVQRGLRGLGERFQRDLAGIAKLPWLMATSATPDGGKPADKNLLVRLLKGYMGVMSEITYVEPEIYDVTMRVSHMIMSPVQLFRPSIVARVLRYWLSGKTSAKRQVPELRPVER
ncbi:MAG TPA: FAD-dependent monooxygenase [Roseiflexaceae bacterium]|nr:FAD-dependent monooxygenase [Roseiflexaceae bacterium]